MNEKDYQILPELTGEEYDRLKADIAENGCKVPVDVDEDGNILDGHHRVEICDELGVEYETRVISDLTEEEKYEHVLRMNVVRRQMTGEQLDELIKELKERFPNYSDWKIAETIGVSHTRVSSVISALEEDEEWKDDKEWAEEKEDWNKEEWEDEQDREDIELLDKILGRDDKNYPGRNVEKQREMVRKEVAKDPDRSDREIAKKLGVSHHTVALQRKKMDEESNEEQKEDTAINKETATQSETSEASISTADELYAVLKGEAERLECMFSSLLDKKGANATLLFTDEGLEAAVGGLVEISDVVRKYRNLITD